MEEMFLWIVISDDHTFVDEKYEIDANVYGPHLYKKLRTIIDRKQYIINYLQN